MLGRILARLGGRRPARAAPPPEPAPEPTPSTEPPPSGVPDIPFVIRPLEDADLAHLPALFRAAVHGLAGNDYTVAERDAWTGFDDESLKQQLARGTTIVALAWGTPVAFAQLAPSDYFSMLYVHPDHAGGGIAALLCQYLEDEARIAGVDAITTHASRTARPIFANMGFREEGPETVERNGVALERFRMVKRLR